MFADYEGVNLNEESKAKPYDMHCPLMGGTSYKRLNYYAVLCKERQLKPSMYKSCYPFCRMTEEGKMRARQYDAIGKRENEAKALAARRAMYKERKLQRDMQPLIRSK